MRLAPLYRNALLLTGLLLSGIAAVQAADWPRQITDSRGTHTLESQPQRIVSTIAPTLIINYDDKSWQSLLTQLGEITGHEKQAAERIAQFDKQLAAAKEQIKLPPQPVTAIVYTAAAHSANLWTPESAQGQMLEQLGFTLAKLPAGLNASQSQGKRHDIIQLGGENLAAGLNGESLFLFAGDQKDADAIYANPLLAHLPAVQNKQVYALGTETFRLDYYSAMQVLDRLKALF